MNFTQWVEEQGLPLPDARQFSYIACVLDVLSQDHLEGMAEKWFLEKFSHSFPPNWRWRSHHMTVLFRIGGILTEDMEAYRPMFGQSVQLHITGIAANDVCAAVVVKPNKTFNVSNPIPHVTIAHSKSVGPNESNRLLADTNNIQRLNEVVELNSVFVAVKKDQVHVWPEQLGFKIAKS
jgi:Fungal tRNA ligase phosphodiesterase domain